MEHQPAQPRDPSPRIEGQKLAKRLAVLRIDNAACRAEESEPRIHQEINDYLDVSRYLLDQVRIEHGSAFAVYLDQQDPSRLVDALRDDFLHRYLGHYISSDELLCRLFTHEQRTRHSFNELWDVLTEHYDIAEDDDGGLCVFTKAAGQ